MYKILKLFPFISESVSEEFHEKTKIFKFNKEGKGHKVPEEWVRVFYKGYERFEKIKLPKVKSLDNNNFEEILFKRKSIREFDSKPIALKDLSTLLYYSAGLRIKGKDAGNRFYPSAGSRYPLELYLVVNNCEDLKKGVYHYNIKNHSLEYMWSVDEQEFIKNFSHSWIPKSPLIIFITGVFWRTQVKYSSRGYRHVLTEAGLLTQNIYLICTSLGLGCSSLGGYLDNEINKLLGLKYSEETVISVIATGNKKFGSERR